MDKKLLKSKISLFGDCFTDLALVVGCSRSRLSAKINERNGAEFTAKEIERIKLKYDLSADDVDKIFFANQVS